MNKMIKNKPNSKLNLQLFAAVGDNAVMQDTRTGNVPTEQSKLIIQDFVKGSAVMGLAKYEKMTKPKKEFTYLADGVGAYWVNEGQKIGVSKPTWLKAEMEAKKLGVIIPVTNEALNWSVPEFFANMRSAIAEAFYTKYDQATLFGKDSPYASGQNIWANITTAGNKLEEGSTKKGLGTESSKLMSMIEMEDKEPNGWTTTIRFKDALRTAKDELGNPLFKDKTKAEPATLHGLPIGYVKSKSWDHKKARVITGDWDYARYGVLKNIEYKISEDATLDVLGEDGKPINLFERDMVALRVTMHVAFMVLKEGAFSALTPKAGA
ncbi:MAG: phage major capsid protein [Tepidibacter sp.]|jgi:HK97 family phage major capsid protein|uniref:phage major capsid protein n=1 Tax=Tepidibacter sp. TaxID=2529387 RepID=UPI0025E3E85A|nr:phage major capsid protein [Tepidibacter sp.]MCT4507934.1 phage major capsid protein [Tepidibacter sp.]